MENDTNSVDSILLNKKRKADDNELHNLIHKEEAEDHSPSESEINEEEEEEEEEGQEQERVSRRKISHGCHIVRGKMGHCMEDYVAAETRKVNGHELGLYAIYDGHSGHDVAKYLQSHLFDNILNEPGFWKNPKGAIKKAYKETDDDILEGVVGSRGGSTAVTAIVIDGKTLIVANVADSRAVLCRNGEAKAVSVDHEPKEEEKEAVESRGGCVLKRPGNVARVDGQLAMTRAFGDGRLKEHITSEPDLMTERIDEEVDWLILGSDGLWKVMTNEEAYECVKEMGDAEGASEKLVQEALARGSADDISCIAVAFNSLLA